MSKRSLNILLIAGLLLSNLLLISFIVFRKPPHPPKPREIIIRKLDFDKEQLAKYDLLILEHQKQIKAKEQEMMSLKKELYTELSKAEASDKSDSLSLEIGKVQTQIEQVHFKHFGDIKGICKAEQLAAYQALTQELSKMFSRPRMK